MAVGPTITTMRSSSPRTAFDSAVRVLLTVSYTSASAGASSIRHAEGTRGRIACQAAVQTYGHAEHPRAVQWAARRMQQASAHLDAEVVQRVCHVLLLVPPLASLAKLEINRGESARGRYAWRKADAERGPHRRIYGFLSHRSW